MFADIHPYTIVKMTYVIFFFSLLVQALGGFGAGLLAVPLLTLLYEPRFIIPAFSVVNLLLNLIILFEVRTKIAWKKVSVIVIGSLMGLPAGVFALKYLDQKVIGLLIAMVTFVLGLLFFCGFKPKIKRSSFSFIVTGVISGFLSSVAAMGGPPLIFLMMALGLKKDVFRATLVACFIFNGVVSISLYFINGLFNPANVRISLFALLPALAGTLLGIGIKNILAEEKFRRITVITIILIGVFGTFRAASLLGK